MGVAEKLEQAGIFILGVLAIILVGLEPTNPFQRYGFVLGLLSQPCWIYFAIRTKAYGILCLSLIYTVSWINGINNHW